MSKTIINGVDVSECLFSIIATDKTVYCRKDLDSNGTPIYKCEENKLCYFKQLKRLEQQIEAYQLSENEAKEIIAELKHRNKELKKENEQLKKPCLVMPKVNQLAVLVDRYKKLYKALEEIRSYCDEQNLKADYTACYITNRIDEVLEDSEDDANTL